MSNEMSPKLAAITSYTAVAAGQTAQSLGGGKGGILHRIVITVVTSASGTFSIKDGSDTAISITAANTPIGVYVVDFGGLRSRTGAWAITTGAGASVVAIGQFA